MRVKNDNRIGCDEIRIDSDELVRVPREFRCIKEREIWKVSESIDRIEKFIDETEPLLEFVKTESRKNKLRSELYQKIIEHVLGAGAIAVFSFVGFWVITKIKEELGLKNGHN